MSEYHPVSTEILKELVYNESENQKERKQRKKTEKNAGKFDEWRERRNAK